MKVEIIIEQFDNGISLKVQGGRSFVAMGHDKTRAIGDVLWEDIKNLMDCTPTNKVRMNIEYSSEEGEK